MPLPDRWEQYCPMGKVIPNTKFLAFKVPLKQQLLQDVTESDRFSPSSIMDTLQDQGKKLGLIIDLTFTTKYYNRQDFENNNVLYKKIFVQGAKSGQLVPADSNFQEFVEAVKGYDKEDVVGVHCTHGVNRTGYFICRYMIEELRFDPEDALKSFGEARGHPIERDTYIKDLLQRKKGVSTVTVRPVCEQTSSRKPSQHKSTTERKPRWRANRDQHPGWCQSSSESSSQGPDDGLQCNTHREHQLYSVPPNNPSFGFPLNERGHHSKPSEHQQGMYSRSWGPGMRWNSHPEDSNSVENKSNTGSPFANSRLIARDRCGFDGYRRGSDYHSQYHNHNNSGFRGGFRQMHPYPRGQGSRSRDCNQDQHDNDVKYRNAGWTTKSNCRK